MPIKLAFSTVACPEWTLPQVLDRAKSIGYHGIEIRTLGPGGSALVSDPALSEVAKTRGLFGASGIESLCLSTSISLHHRNESAAREAHWQTMQAIELAAGVGCRFVRVFAHEAQPGADRRSVIQRIAQRVKPLADAAANQGIQLLFENAGSFALAKEWWWLLDLVDHPMVGLCWNVANAAAAGEPPSVSVPVLHSRIRLAKVKDTKIGEGSGFVPLGEGTVGVREFVKRLLGIGYDGFITVEWDRLWFPSLASADEYLPEAHKRIKGWIDEAAKAIEDAKPKPKPAKGEVKPKPAAAH